MARPASLSLLWWTLLLVSVQPAPSQANLFGRDQRIAASGLGAEFENIGLVRQRKGNHTLETCTGTLIASRLLLTAAHCVALKNGKLSSSIKTEFLSGVVGRRLPDGARVTHATHAWVGQWRKESDSRSGDWAVLLLNESPWGDAAARRKYFSVGDRVPAPGSSLASIGYSSDFYGGRLPSADFRCAVRAVTNEKVLQHDCAVFAGASGGPLLARVADKGTTEWRIVGIHNAHKSQGSPGLRLRKFLPEFANLAASTENAASGLNEARAAIATLASHSPTSEVH